MRRDLLVLWFGLVIAGVIADDSKSEDAKYSVYDELGPKYNIVVKNEARTVESLLADSQRVTMVSPRDGTKYSCLIPAVKSEEDEAQQEELAASKTVAEYLKPLENACLYRIRDWWTYEFCYGKHMRQYHQEQNVVTAEFILGNAPHRSDSQQESTAPQYTGTAPYYSEQYTGGTRCDLTHQPRTAEIQYVCTGEDKSYIDLIKEPSTCNYVVTIKTPYLCQHPAYTLKTPKTYTIECTPLPTLVSKMPVDSGKSTSANRGEAGKTTTDEQAAQSSPTPVLTEQALAETEDSSSAKIASGETPKQSETKRQGSLKLTIEEENDEEERASV